MATNVPSDTKHYESLAERRSINYAKVARALDIVRAFVMRKKRILYGGMAIDLSLKLRGSGIYGPDVLPDYDFMSPTHAEDSYELADILHKEGLGDISSIQAIHISSRRVRIDFVPVADITYIPPAIYDKLPTVRMPAELTNSAVGGASSSRAPQGYLRVIHPDFQRMDMHRAFCIPFEKPPREVVLHRLKKDMARFNLFWEYYPLKHKTSATGLGMARAKVPGEFLQNSVVCGLAAYSIIYEIFNDLFIRCDSKTPALKALCKLMKSSAIRAVTKAKEMQALLREVIQLKIKPLKLDKFGLALDIPKLSDASGTRGAVTLATDDFESFTRAAGKKSSPRYFDKYLDDYRPRTVGLSINRQPYEIFDNKSRLLPVWNMERLGLGTMRVCNYQYIMLYLLQKHFTTAKPDKAAYRALYISLQAMITYVGNIAAAIKDEQLRRKFYDMLPFFLSTETYGCCNWSPDYIKFVVEKREMILAAVGAPITKTVFREPFGYYPETATEWPKFDFSQSEMFAFSGAERKTPFKPVSLTS